VVSSAYGINLDSRMVDKMFYVVDKSDITPHYITVKEITICLCIQKLCIHHHHHHHSSGIYLLTYSMVQSPSLEANWFAASQKIPHISWNPKVHYRTHKCPPPVSILGQANPVHIPTSHLLEIHPNIIHPTTPTSPQWSPSLQFPDQDPILPLS